MNKKLDELTKIKLIYTIELVVIAVVFLVLGILELTKVIIISESHRNIFTWITVFGGSYIIFDAIWAFVSAKKRKKVSLFDKITTLPAGIYVVALAIYTFINISSFDTSVHQICIPILFIYIFVIYTIQAIYHWKHPVPGLLEEEEKEEENKDINSQLLAGDPIIENELPERNMEEEPKE